MNASSGWLGIFRQDAVLAAIALLAGAGGVLLASQYLEKRASDKSAELESRYASVPVVVAATDIAQGSTLQVSSLAARQMPGAYLPADVVGVDRAGDLPGKTARIEIRRGTPILTSAVQSAMDGTTLAATLSPSERALTIAVDEISSHAGGLRIGDHVDLYHGRSVAGEAVLVPLLQHVQVLGVGSALREGTDGDPDDFTDRRYATVTLRVSASDAPRLLLAQQAGQVALLLRAADDDALQPNRVLRAAELLQPASPGSKRATPGMELLVGGAGSPTPERSWLRTGAAGRSGEST